MTKKLARLIKTERDFISAASVANKIRKQTKREPDAETRLQSLIEAMEKFEEQDEIEVEDAAEEISGLPRRRWSDDAPEPQ